MDLFEKFATLIQPELPQGYDLETLERKYTTKDERSPDDFVFLCLEVVWKIGNPRIQLT